MEEENNIRIAAIITCFNRIAFTKRCVEQLLNESKRLSHISLDFYIWDDGSTDGTAEAVSSISDSIKVFRGPGNYYWSKSMFFAMKEALKSDYDFYLMVNDDVDFYQNALEIMLNSYHLAKRKCAIVGTTQFNNEFSYGGRDNKFSVIVPSDELKECYYANWNCFLIDRYVVDRVGLISPKYRHSGGDSDYSCRMRRAGIPQYVATQFVGICQNDHDDPPYYDPKLSVYERLRALFSPKGKPFGSYLRFHWVDKRFKGILIAIYMYTLLILKVLTCSG